MFNIKYVTIRIYECDKSMHHSKSYIIVLYTTNCISYGRS